MIQPVLDRSIRDTWSSETDNHLVNQRTGGHTFSTKHSANAQIRDCVGLCTHSDLHGLTCLDCDEFLKPDKKDQVNEKKLDVSLIMFGSRATEIQNYFIDIVRGYTTFPVAWIRRSDQMWTLTCQPVTR